MKIDMSRWKQSVLHSSQRLAIPILTHPGIETIGKRVVDAVTDGRIHYEAIRALNEKYPAAAASTAIMDLTVEAEAFGAKVYFTPAEVPAVTGWLVTDRTAVEQLAVPRPDRGRLQEYLLANRLAVESMEKPVLAGCIGPFSLAGRLYGMSEIMVALYTAPETIRLLLSKCTSFIISYCEILKEQGSNGVLMAEPAAGLLSNDACNNFSSEYVKEIVKQVQDDDFIVILHNCGNTGHCTGAMTATGAAGYHFGNRIDMKTALRECPGDALVMGNLDPAGLFKMSAPEEVYRQTRELLEETRMHPNFILSSGCDISPLTPEKNIEMFYQALADFNAR